MEKKYELLAPAGDEAALISAVNAGADAVYLGGELFNARAQARNFTKDELARAVAFAHARDVKIYVAMNTLLGDKESEEAFEYAYFLYREGADALIIQDLGLAAWSAKNLPDFDRHLSTQGTVYNAEGARAAKRLGFKRVVLARETTLEEIREIASACEIEIEAFVHGALCVCYSGQCGMSGYIGGRSGNKGSCAQPCRLPYKDKTGKSTYLLSPKDLCALDFLGELAEVGVCSFKIEGRMKSPAYVGIVTSIYKKYLDRLREGKHYKVSAEDRNALLQIFNRGFTSGYYHGNKGRGLMTENLPKHQGVPIGKLCAKKDGGQFADIALARGMTVNIGDGIEIRARQLTGNVVTYHKTLGTGMVRVGDIKGKAEIGDEVYKITDKNLMKSAAAFFDGTILKKIGVNMKLSAALNELPTLEIDGGGEKTVAVGRIAAQKAEKKELTKEIVIRQLAKTGDTPFAAKNINVLMDSGISLPLSEINRLRREALAAFELKKIGATKREIQKTEIKGNYANTNTYTRAYHDKNKETDKDQDNDPYEHKFASLFFYGGLSAKAETIEKKLELLQAAGIKRGDIKILVPLYDFMQSELGYEDSPEFVPYILNVSKGKTDDYIRAHFAEIVKKTARSGISVGNLGWIHELASKGVTVYGDYGLNIMNKAALDAVLELGVCALLSKSLEVSSGNFGRVPLMISEHIFNEPYIVDRKGKKYAIIKNEFGDKSIVLSDEISIEPKAVAKAHRDGMNIRIYCE